MDRNLAPCQYRLKLQLAHFSQTARLRKSQPGLLEKCYRELPLQLQLAHMSRGEHFVCNRYRHCPWWDYTAIGSGTASSDVQGGDQLKCQIPEAVTVFILAPSREVLEHRLRARGEDREDIIERRLRAAAEEIGNYQAYDYVLINRDLAQSDAILSAIVHAERVRRTRIEDQIRPILETFHN
jgi:Guanylate kinase